MGRRLGWCACGAVAWLLAASPQPAEAGPARAEGPGRAAAIAAAPDLPKLAEAVMPGVVGVITLQGEREAPPAGDPLRDLYDHFRGDGPKRGLATGFVIDPSGLILTNAHVVENAGRVEVEIGEDDERFPARVVGRDEASDVALLQVDAGRPLTALPLGDSDGLRVAEWLMVVGNPFGLSHTVTLGIVSHTGRADVAPAGREGFYDFIQTDASINPGNSGGPVVNLKGEVIGIATAVNATGQGIGFAVPINMAKEILGQLRDHGQVVRSWMGVSVRELRGGPAPSGKRQVIVTELAPGGPAASGGLKVGDVITGFDGRRVASAARLRWYVATAGVGRNVALDVRRGEAAQSVKVQLRELPQESASLRPASRRAATPVAPED
jgi:serine protease Do